MELSDTAGRVKLSISTPKTKVMCNSVDTTLEAWSTVTTCIADTGNALTKLRSLKKLNMLFETQAPATKQQHPLFINLRM